MNITLLTHERELSRKDNTGKLVLEILGKQANLVQWKRKEPSEIVLNLFSSTQTALLYPSPDAEEAIDITQIENFVLLDGTWQEARKMYQKSNYLLNAQKLTLEIEKPSIYTLRRNQRVGGLCTAEVVQEILMLKGETERAKLLEERLQHFIDNREDLL